MSRTMSREPMPAVPAVPAVPAMPALRMSVLFLVPALTIALYFGVCAPEIARAQEYKYNPASKVDPFLPLTLRKPNIRGLSRLQDYEIPQLELVGTVLGAEITALVLTPEPREGILAKIGDRVGKKGGRIIAIARNKVVVREPSTGLLVPGRAQKFVDVTMVLASRGGASSGNGIQSNRESEQMGFPSLAPSVPGSQGKPAPGRIEGRDAAPDPADGSRSPDRGRPSGSAPRPPPNEGNLPSQSAQGFAPVSIPASSIPPSSIPPSLIPPSSVGGPAPGFGASASARGAESAPQGIVIPPGTGIPAVEMPAGTPLTPGLGAPTSR